MAKEYNITKTDGLCLKCQKQLEPGDEFSATVRETTEDLCKLLEVEHPEEIGNVELTGVTTLEAAGPSDVSFLSRPKFRDAARKSSTGG